MGLHFTKMHGLGNDFMVIDAIRQSVHLSPTDIQALSHRHTGVGFDQCLIIEKSDNPDIDFFYRIFNADGSMVGQCGNGARCIARFIQREKLSDKTELTVATTTTKLTLKINTDHSVTVNMGIPLFDSTTALSGIDETVHIVDIGNPHAVLCVEDINTAPIQTLGPGIEMHSYFPNHTNVGFFERVSDKHMKLRVHERGVGETNACGSGACAAAAVMKQFYQGTNTIKVSLLGGELTIDWQGTGTPLFMTGPAEFVYQGTLLLPPT